MIDVYIALFMGLTLMFFALAEKYPEKRRLFLTLMYIAAGLGVMTKGPVAAALPALVFLIYLAAERRLRSVRQMMLIPGALIVAAIVLPWYLAIYSEHGWLYIKDFLLRDNLSRYTEPVWGPRRGYFFYLPVMLGDLFPWSWFLFAAIGAMVIPTFRKLLRSLRSQRQPAQANSSGEALEAAGSTLITSQTKLLLIWIAVMSSFTRYRATKKISISHPSTRQQRRWSASGWRQPFSGRRPTRQRLSGGSQRLWDCSILLLGGTVFYGFRGQRVRSARRDGCQAWLAFGGGMSFWH